jgi:membrane-bound metal-dependent hydrolase YbcI (DUF457 family)
VKRALACLATIAVADAVLHRKRVPWLAIGIFDHPAHLATSGLVAVNVQGRGARWLQGLMAGSLLPDLDHVPLALRRDRPKQGDPRPVTHCLLSVAPVAVLARATGDERLHGVVAGMLSHFARDLAVGSGVPLLWPGTRRSFKVPYPAYAIALSVLALAPAYSRSRP